MTHGSEPRPIRHILLCYDGSAEAERALARAAALARPPGTSVSVISVAEPIYGTPPYDGFADPNEEKAHRRLLEEATHKLADRGISAATVERVGGVADVVAGVAREVGADLIVVGSRHRKLLRRLLLGSVSVRLVVGAPCDVLVVR